MVNIKSAAQRLEHLHSITSAIYKFFLKVELIIHDFRI